MNSEPPTRRADGSVLFVLPQKSPGGLHRLVQELAPALEDAGFAVAAVVPDAVSGSAGVEPVDVFGSPSLRTIPHPRRDPRTAASLVARPGRHARAVALDVERNLGVRPSIVHVFGFLDPIGPALASELGAHLVWSVNSSIVPWWAAPWARRKLGAAAGTLFEGEELRARYAPRNRQVPQQVFYPAARQDLANPDREAGRLLRARFGIPADDLLVATWSNLTPQKDLARFVDYAASAARQRAGVSFAVIGRTVQGHEHLPQMLAKRADDTGMLRSRFHLVVDEGLQADEALSMIDVFALTSRYEGVATATIEALSAGLPVIAHRVGSVPDLVEPGRTGHLVEPGDVAGFVHAVLDVVDDPSRAASMARAGQERVFALCRPGSLQDAFIGVYRGVVGARGQTT